MVDLVEPPVGVAGYDMDWQLARRGIGRVDRAVVKVDDGDDILVPKRSFWSAISILLSLRLELFDHRAVTGPSQHSA